eukprot:6490794-Amphidinium_carterae.2
MHHIGKSENEEMCPPFAEWCLPLLSVPLPRLSRVSLPFLRIRTMPPPSAASFTRCFPCGVQSACGPSHFEVVDDDKNVPCEDKQLELARIHWQKVFQSDGGNDERAQSVLLRYHPTVFWPPLTTISVDEVAETIAHCPDTALGPDRVTFQMLKSNATLLAPWLHEMLLLVLKGQHLRAGFMDSMLIFIAKPMKDVRATRWKECSELCLLTLYNTCWKVLQKLATYRLQNLLPSWISAQQYGFVKDRYIHDLAYDLEHSRMTVGAQHSEACTTLVKMHVTHVIKLYSLPPLNSTSCFRRFGFEGLEQSRPGVKSVHLVRVVVETLTRLRGKENEVWSTCSPLSRT